MTTLTIRDVPEDVRDTLTRDARERGQSLQAFLLSVIERQAEFSHNRALLVEIDDALSHGAGADSTAPDAADVLAQGRVREDYPSSDASGAA